MKDKIKENWEYVAIAVVVLIVVFNSFQILSISTAINGKSLFSLGSTEKSTTFKVKQGGDVVKNVMDAILVKGTPEYGEALGVSYDSPESSINVLAKLDTQIPTSELTAEEKKRYIAIDLRISCEYCCGAPAVIDQNGRDACGCAHSASFRGLTKYLIKNEPDKWTDEQVLAELTKWKALYYPKNMVEKGIAAVQNGLELSPAVLNDRDLLKKIKVGNTADIGNLPQMVGGC